jgi:threonine/homoserine/homoserine lactone efflux protein
VHLGCILGTVFAFDCTKAVFSHRLSSTVGPAQWRMLNRVSGALIVAFGLAVMSSSLW